MKYIFSLLAAAFLATACHTSKEATETPSVPEVPVTENVDHGSEPTITRTVTGVVVMEETCGAVIEVTYGDVIQRYRPSNLETKYQKEGLKLRFLLKETGDAVVTEACGMLFPIEVSEVMAMR